MRLNRFKTQAIYLVILGLLIGCAAKEVDYGPQETSDDISEKVATANSQLKSKKIALVLGGAGVASFATVGLIKAFNEERIPIKWIISTGWPSLFSAGYGVFPTLHDLEWFTMRLRQSDFFGAGVFNFNEGYAAHKKLEQLIDKAFKKKDLRQSKVPVLVTTTSPKQIEPDVLDDGSIKLALLQSMSVPGLYRPYKRSTGSEWTSSLNGVDVEVAIAKEADIIVAVNMWPDYLNWVRKSREKGREVGAETLFRQIFATQMRTRLEEQMQKAQIKGSIYLRQSPTNFGYRRRAILEGKKLGKRLANQMRNDFAE